MSVEALPGLNAYTACIFSRACPVLPYVNPTTYAFLIWALHAPATTSQL